MAAKEIEYAYEQPLYMFRFSLDDIIHVFINGDALINLSDDVMRRPCRVSRGIVNMAAEKGCLIIVALIHVESNGLHKSYKEGKYDYYILDEKAIIPTSELPDEALQ